MVAKLDVTKANIDKFTLPYVHCESSGIGPKSLEFLYPERSLQRL